MYQEWMDGVPDIVEGCHENNRIEAGIAVAYYEKHGNPEIANYWRNYMNEEARKQEYEESLTTFGKIINKLMYKGGK